jgi:hypothetical protein
VSLEGGELLIVGKVPFFLFRALHGLLVRVWLGDVEGYSETRVSGRRDKI